MFILSSRIVRRRFVRTSTGQKRVRGRFYFPGSSLSKPTSSLWPRDHPLRLWPRVPLRGAHRFPRGIAIASRNRPACCCTVRYSSRSRPGNPLQYRGFGAVTSRSRRSVRRFHPECSPAGSVSKGSRNTVYRRRIRPRNRLRNTSRSTRRTAANHPKGVAP